MTAPGTNGSAKEQLRQALIAAGIDASEERIAQLLPAYQGLLAGAARIAQLDLGETEPAVIYRLPSPE